MRIPGIGGEIMSRLGVTVQVLGAPEIYPALEEEQSMPPSGLGHMTMRSWDFIKLPSITTTLVGGSLAPPRA